MARRKNGDGRNKKTVDAGQVTCQDVLVDSTLAYGHQPIPGPRSQNDSRSSGAVQSMRDVPVGGGVRQRQGNDGPDTAAQTQETAEPDTAVQQQRRQNQRPNTAARTNVKTAKAETPTRATVAVDHKKTANRRFVCPLCAKTFYYKHVLQNHIRTHTGEKPYSCMVCQKRFTRAHHLTTHNRLHTGEKPYLCMCCNRFFLQVSNLRRHLKTHVGCTSMNLCVHCGKVFATFSDLAVHRVKVGTCYRRSQSLKKITASSTSSAIDSTSAASTSAAIDSASAASTSAAAAAAIDSTSAASISAVTAANDSSSATGSAERSASAFVANPPSVSPWRSSTPSHLHHTSVHHAPAPGPSTDYGSSLPWMLNAVYPYWSSWSLPVHDAFLYGLPTHVYSSPDLSFLHGFFETQLLMTSVVYPSPPTAAFYGHLPFLPNDYWTINPYQQYQNVYAAEQTEPENLSVRGHDSGKRKRDV